MPVAQARELVDLPGDLYELMNSELVLWKPVHEIAKSHPCFEVTKDRLVAVMVNCPNVEV